MNLGFTSRCEVFRHCSHGFHYQMRGRLDRYMEVKGLCPVCIVLVIFILIHNFKPCIIIALLYIFIHVSVEICSLAAVFGDYAEAVLVRITVTGIEARRQEKFYLHILCIAFPYIVDIYR